MALTMEGFRKLVDAEKLRYFLAPDRPALMLNVTGINELLKVLGHLNYKLRLVKFAWDPSDGEIVVYADTWLVDTELTQAQSQRVIQGYFSALDMHSSRIDKTLETGKDPGAEDLMAMVERGMGSGLPAELQKLLKDLLERGKKPGAEDKKEEEKRDTKKDDYFDDEEAAALARALGEAYASEAHLTPEGCTRQPCHLRGWPPGGSGLALAAEDKRAEHGRERPPSPTYLYGAFP
jgi:Putative bacterial sensory transduction regulator